MNDIPFYSHEDAASGTVVKFYINGKYTIEKRAFGSGMVSTSKWKIEDGVMYFKHNNKFMTWEQWDNDTDNESYTVHKKIMTEIMTITKELDEILLGEYERSNI